MATWYFAATQGSLPPKIWPVIIPGMETTPTTFMALMSGVMLSWIARCVHSLVASMRVAPNERSSSMWSLPVTNSFKMDVRPTLMPEQLFPRTMPKMGIIYCGSYQGDTPTTRKSPNQTVTAATVPRMSTTKNKARWKVCCGREMASKLATTTISAP